MQLRIWLFFLTMGITCLFSTAVQALTYLNSAHGSTTYGVDRPDLNTAGFAMANCAHCHEQHASIHDTGGSELLPVTGAKEYLLFDQSNTDQETNFCFNCHGTGTPYQAGGHVTNRSYSYRAGSWNLSSITDIKTAFGQASSHNLADIVTFAAAQGWKYTTNSNACAVCHDPHVVQGDPANDSDSSKPGLGRGVAITEVNSSPPNLWGDGVNPDLSPNLNEIMSNYTGSYQGPYRVGLVSYEPAGPNSSGTDLPNYVLFCTKCHDTTSTTFGTQTLKVINWATEKHGQFNADINIAMNNPYVLAAGSYVLSCLDCHEPHGSANQSLIRWEVNGVSWSPATVTGGAFDQLCRRCHNPNTGAVADWEWEHHGGTDAPYNQVGPCTTCHIVGTNRINCATCHYHGAVSGSGGIPPADVAAPANRELF